MSASNNPSDNTKPVVKDKNPHNYRKVGYSMIIISVSLVIIGLLSWNLADNYHFSSNIMALQEVDAMTPKSGYAVVMFDVSQPVGAKLKMLDEADTIDAAQALQTQEEKQNAGNTIQVLLFNSSKDYNLNLMSDAEVFLKTPLKGYNVVLYESALAIGQKLTLGQHFDLLDNATAYQKQQEDNLKGTTTQVLIFTPDYKANLKMITGSDVPVEYYAALAQNMTALAQAAIQTPQNQTAQVNNATSTNMTQAPSPTPPATNQTVAVSANQSMTGSNQTISKVAPQMNMTETTNMTTNMTTTTNQTNASSKTNLGTTATSTPNKLTVIISKGASSTQGTCDETNCYNPQEIKINVGDSVTWINDDTVPHTATYYDGNMSDSSVGTIWDSGMIKAGGTYASPAFTKAGEYPYFCQVHPWMTGEIIVGSESSGESSNNETGTAKTVTLNETIGVNATGK